MPRRRKYAAEFKRELSSWSERAEGKTVLPSTPVAT